MNVAVLFYRIGPYHFARLCSAAKFLRVTAVEYSNVDSFYEWNEVAGGEGFDRARLFQGVPVEQQSVETITARVRAVLSDLRPEVVVVPGWHDRCALAALSWCCAQGVPAVVMSESTPWDSDRKRWKEAIKRWIIRHFAAALVGGTSHARYLETLGMPRDRIFLGYDAVDNGYFEEKVAEVRMQNAECRNEYGLPEKYFLASARFIEKKNLPRLLQAFAKYREKAEMLKAEMLKGEGQRPEDGGRKTEGRGGNAKTLKTEMLKADGPWELVLLGDGPLKSALNSQLSTLNLHGHVLMPGFKQYPDLPAYYGLASAFVHASTTEQWGLVVNEAMASGLPVLVSNRCGCAPDLVQDGVNGFTFDPYNVEQMAELMLKISAFRPFSLSAFGNASCRIIADWGPERFAIGLQAACGAALANGGQRVSNVSRIFLKATARGVGAASPEETVAAPESPKNGRMLLFRFRGRRVLALPEQPRALHKLGTARFQAHTTKRRAYMRLVADSLFLRAHRLFCSVVAIGDAKALGVDYPRWVGMVQERLGKPNLQAVLVWPPQAARQRFYLHVFDDRLQPCAFVKVSSLIGQQSSLEISINALTELGANPFRHFRLPRPLGCGIFDGLPFAMQEAMPAETKPLAWNSHTDVLPLVEELCLGRQRLPAESIMALSWWQRYASNVPPGCALFHTGLIARLAQGAQMGRVHGDFGLANMASDGHRIWLFDWENTHPHGPVLVDRVGYFLSFSVGKSIQRPGRHMQRFAKQFLEGADSQRRLDVMLALAYRHASGIPDAVVYMRHWQEPESGTGRGNRHD